MLERLVDLLAGNSLDIGYAFVFFVLLLCGFGLPMPEDVVLVTGRRARLARPRTSRRVSLGGMLRDRGLARDGRGRALRDPRRRHRDLPRRPPLRPPRRGLPAAAPDHHPGEARARREEGPHARQRGGDVRALPARAARADLLHGRARADAAVGVPALRRRRRRSSRRRSGSASASGSARTSRRRRTSRGGSATTSCSGSRVVLAALALRWLQARRARRRRRRRPTPSGSERALARLDPRGG